MKIGYVRVSTVDQNSDLQHDALKQAGCEKIFSDKISGAKSDRPGLQEALNYLRPGDSLVVWKLDRLGRNLRHLMEVIEDLNSKGIGFVSLQDKHDTTTSGGKLIFHIFASLAEFERDLIRERTMAGLTAARARGRLGGRSRKLDHGQLLTLERLHNSRAHRVNVMCEMLSISRATFYRNLKIIQEKRDVGITKE